MRAFSPQRWLWPPLCALLWLLATASAGDAQDDASRNTAEASAQEKPRPTTTADPEIPVEHLELLVKPLTREELVVEADAWRDLLKANVQRIAEVRIALKKEHLAVEAPQTDGEAAAGAAERKQQLAAALPKLQEEKEGLVDRLTVVLAELKAKGGDIESYRQYVAALTGVAVEVTDAATLWTMTSGWLSSQQGGKRWFWNIIRFVVIIVVFHFGARVVANLVCRAARRAKNTSKLLVDFLGTFVRQAVTIIGFVVALAALEVDITPLLAAIGAAGLVVGLALQDTLGNFASGMLILAYRPFDVGDVIEAAGVSGFVKSVTLFSTHVRTFDNKLMIVPNSDIWGGTITNATASDTRRVDMVFGIGYQDDVAQAQGILEALVRKHELVLDDPAPVIQLHELGDSSVNFVCRPWTKTADYWTVYWDITRAVKEEFDRNGITIPFPQRDVHVHQQASAAASRLDGGQQA